MTAKDYDYFLGLARRYSRVRHEAQDLLQEALIVATEANRYDFTEPTNRAWMHGIIRNKARDFGRSAVRRKSRDAHFSSEEERKALLPENQEPLAMTHQFLRTLAPSSRIVATLVLHGLNRKEIATVLHLSNTALRKRLSAIRKALAPLPTETRYEILASAYASRHLSDSHPTPLPIGLMRKVLLKRLEQELQMGHHSVGTHDPSGHLIVIKGENK